MEESADNYISATIGRDEAPPEASHPGGRESRENLRKFMEEVALELNLKRSVGIWLDREWKKAPTQYPGVQRERIQGGEYWQINSPHV